VTTPAEDRLAEALALAEHAEREGFRLSGVVLNRMLDEPTFDALTTAPRRMPGHLRDIAKLRAALGGDSAKDPRLAALVAHFERYAANHRSELERALRFARELKSPIELIVAPEIEMSVRDLRSLARLGGILTAPVAGRKFLENAALACGVTQKSPRSGPPR
ncbi:MAG TPA: hypothetical protein VJN94_10235, partial [Candidatus Binataceae bacterium]|nr:hypothetical protein [Candidatus Binataceae bacterium]